MPKSISVDRKKAKDNYICTIEKELRPWNIFMALCVRVCVRAFDLQSVYVEGRSTGARFRFGFNLSLSAI